MMNIFDTVSVARDVLNSVFSTMDSFAMLHTFSGKFVSRA